MHKTTLLILGLGPSLGVCTIIPKHARPSTPLPTSWLSDPALMEFNTPSVSTVADLNRRKFFTDEKLKAPKEYALANNRDLRAATKNVEKVRAF